MKSLIAIAVATILALSSATASAGDLETRHHIEVTGTAEVKAVPDEFVIRAEIRSFDEDLQAATRANEESVRKAFIGIKKLGVDRRYIVTDEVSVNSVTEGYRERGNFRLVGYSVSRNFTVVLHDSAKIQPAFRQLFAAGVDRLSMSAHSTEMEKHLKAARRAAAKDARSKADDLTSALGRSLGQAVAIIEQSPGQHQASNFVYSSSTPDLGDGFSLGKLKVRASVRVKFLLD